MSDPRRVQTASKSVASGTSTCKVTLDAATTKGNLVVVTASVTHSGSGTTVTGPDGFTQVAKLTANEITSAMWYRENSPSITSVSVTNGASRSTQVWVAEYAGAAQSNALDKVTAKYHARDSDDPTTGTTATTTQANEVVVGMIANRYSSTTQSGFTGGLTKIAEITTPTSDSDDRRTRATVHEKVVTATGQFNLSGMLSTNRDWVAILATFKSGATGPVRFSSTTAGPTLQITGRASLSMFGPLRATNPGPALTFTGSARIGPFDYQYRLGGWGSDGLTIGEGTDVEVLAIEGLEGWTMRTSDEPLSAEDGDQRGDDLQAAREVLFEVECGGTAAQVEALLDKLYRALLPSRSGNRELIWRHPGRALRMIRYRPTNVGRELDWRRTLLQDQKFVLRAVDPRHYSAGQRQTVVPVSTGIDPTLVTIHNAGNANAYPEIRALVPGNSTTEVTRVDLVNTTMAGTGFVVAAPLPPGTELVGDMTAHVTDTALPVITIGGQSKYGAWQQPRQPFALAPGDNQVYLRVEPAGATVSCLVRHYDTSAG